MVSNQPEAHPALTFNLNAWICRDIFAQSADKYIQATSIKEVWLSPYFA